MLTETFRDVITSEAELRAYLGEPSEVVRRKVLPALDAHCRSFIARSPFALVGTADAEGNCDVSPRGDGPGFALVLDDRTVVIPERPGNRRADTLSNLLQNPHAGILFVVPNVEETLRVNGRATLVRDADLMARLAVDGKAPRLAIVVEVAECFFHCAKSFKRAKLWHPDAWPARSELPTLGQIIHDQVPIPGRTVEEAERYIEDGYKRLY